MLDALARLPDIEPFVFDELYFVLHAARQAGKTTALKALVKKLNAAGSIRESSTAKRFIATACDRLSPFFDIIRGKEIQKSKGKEDER